MKIFRKIAAFFRRIKEPARVIPVTDTPPTTSKDQACKTSEIGQTETPSFLPQTLMSWYGMYMASKTLSSSFVNISQVLALNLFNPLTKAFITTVFAIKGEDGFYWSAIGTKTVYYSEFNAFIYDYADVFRIPLRKYKGRQIVAVCKYKKGEIIVNALLLESNAPISDYESDVIIDCPITPCSLAKAGKFAMNMP